MERMDEFDRRLKDLEQRFIEATSVDSFSGPWLNRDVQESPGVVHNRLGESCSIKLVYPSFYLDLSYPYGEFSVGFPSMKQKLAASVPESYHLFVYVTSPERRIIGLARTVAPAELAPEKDKKRPWRLRLEWLLGPKNPGLAFSDVGLVTKARIGDSVYGIPYEVGESITKALECMADLDETALEMKRHKYKNYG